MSKLKPYIINKFTLVIKKDMHFLFPITLCLLLLHFSRGQTYLNLTDIEFNDYFYLQNYHTGDYLRMSYIIMKGETVPLNHRNQFKFNDVGDNKVSLTSYYNYFNILLNYRIHGGQGRYYGDEGYSGAESTKFRIVEGNHEGTIALQDLNGNYFSDILESVGDPEYRFDDTSTISDVSSWVIHDAGKLRDYSWKQVHASANGGTDSSFPNPAFPADKSYEFGFQLTLNEIVNDTKSIATISALKGNSILDGEYPMQMWIESGNFLRVAIIRNHVNLVQCNSTVPVLNETPHYIIYGWNRNYIYLKIDGVEVCRTFEPNLVANANYAYEEEVHYFLGSIDENFADATIGKDTSIVDTVSLNRVQIDDFFSFDSSTEVVIMNGNKEYLCNDSDCIVNVTKYNDNTFSLSNGGKYLAFSSNEFQFVSDDSKNFWMMEGKLENSYSFNYEDEFGFPTLKNTTLYTARDLEDDASSWFVKFLISENLLLSNVEELIPNNYGTFQFYFTLALLHPQNSSKSIANLELGNGDEPFRLDVNSNNELEVSVLDSSGVVLGECTSNKNLTLGVEYSILYRKEIQYFYLEIDGEIVCDNSEIDYNFDYSSVKLHTTYDNNPAIAVFENYYFTNLTDSPTTSPSVSPTLSPIPTAHPSVSPTMSPTPFNLQNNILTDIVYIKKFASSTHKYTCIYGDINGFKIKYRSTITGLDCLFSMTKYGSNIISLSPLSYPNHALYYDEVWSNARFDDINNLLLEDMELNVVIGIDQDTYAFNFVKNGKYISDISVSDNLDYLSSYYMEGLVDNSFLMEDVTFSIPKNGLFEFHFTLNVLMASNGTIANLETPNGNELMRVHIQDEYLKFDVVESNSVIVSCTTSIQMPILEEKHVMYEINHDGIYVSVDGVQVCSELHSLNSFMSNVNYNTTLLHTTYDDNPARVVFKDYYFVETPTQAPTPSPSLSPSTSPSFSPSTSPSVSPSKSPSTSPSVSPSISPTGPPTHPLKRYEIIPNRYCGNQPYSIFATGGSTVTEINFDSLSEEAKLGFSSVTEAFCQARCNSLFDCYYYRFWDRPVNDYCNTYSRCQSLDTDSGTGESTLGVVIVDDLTVNALAHTKCTESSLSTHTDLSVDDCFLACNSTTNCNYYETFSDSSVSTCRLIENCSQDSQIGYVLYTMSSAPTNAPTFSPTHSPSVSPTISPTMTPSTMPTSSPTMSPSVSPSMSPSKSPSISPSTSPSSAPTILLPTFHDRFSIGLRFIDATFNASEHDTLNFREYVKEKISYVLEIENDLVSINSVYEGSVIVKADILETNLTLGSFDNFTESIKESVIDNDYGLGNNMQFNMLPPLPTNMPSKSPSSSPTNSPTISPSSSPTNSPTISPSLSPSTSPTISPSLSPSTSPTILSTDYPTSSPSTSPTGSPTSSPSTPTHSPTTKSPTVTIEKVEVHLGTILGIAAGISSFLTILIISLLKLFI